MTTIKAVIGSNYGDEGKGKMTDYFASQTDSKCLVVCTNGGAQRGHTVVVTPVKKHIFHHFGSGTLAGADTYLSKYFIVNPMIFIKEAEELSKYEPKVFIHPECMLSTPFDMLLNQMIEEQREVRHGSCGVGIWETILRNGIRFADVLTMSDDQLRQYLGYIRDTYCLHRLHVKRMVIPKWWEKIYYNPNLIENYITDLRTMIRVTQVADDSILYQYNSIIFENGQGLCLDSNSEDSKHSTPSNTGSKNIKEILDGFNADYQLEVCYVTRSYFTRHGNGELDYECDAVRFKDLKPQTETNVWNIHQGSFRYGVINNYWSIYERCEKDFNTYWNNKNHVMTYAITHCDEKHVLKWDFPPTKTVYIGNGPKREDMEVANGIKE